MKAEKGKGSRLLDWDSAWKMFIGLTWLGLGTSLGCSLLIQAKSYIALPLTTVHLYILASMLIEELFSLS